MIETILIVLGIAVGIYALIVVYQSKTVELFDDDEECKK